VSVTSEDDTRPRRIDVVIPVSRHGREVTATIRSTEAAARAVGDAVAVDIILVVSDALVARLPEAAAGHRLLSESTDVSSLLIAAGCAASAADIVAVVEAGNHLSAPFLAALGAGDVSEHRVWCPEVVITFGLRTGTARQPAYAPEAVGARDLARRLAREKVWESTLAGTPAVIASAFRKAGSAGVVAASAALLDAGVRVVPVPGAATFIRCWTAEAPRVHAGPILSPVDLLASSTLAPTDAREVGRAASHSGRGRRVLRTAMHLLRPWQETAASVRARRAAPHRFSLPLLAQWFEANRCDALVPFPRGDVAVWAEDWDAQAARRRSEIDAYWWIMDRLGPAPDYVLFAPWLRKGGGDTVVIQYIQSIQRQDPTASVALITTEPVRSTRLADLPHSVAVVELSEMLERGIHRDALVEWIVPQLLAQLSPHTVHAFNSTVAFDVVEQFGDVLAGRSRLFLSTFAIDRSSDGEALSVLFLRRPGFLDPVSAVLVDSQFFVDRVVSELGYSREKFRVQRSVVGVPEGIVSGPRSTPLRVLWAGRFDTPKRLDVFAAVVEAARTRGLAVDFHFYGLEVMGASGLAETLKRLERAGAVRHAPFATFDDVSECGYGAYILTSEWEGIPLTILEAMAAGIPVIAPLVGGIDEVLTERTGYPVDQFEDVDAYLAALSAVITDPSESAVRSQRARAVIRESFSDGAFDAQLRNDGRYFRQR